MLCSRTLSKTITADPRVNDSAQPAVFHSEFVGSRSGSPSFARGTPPFDGRLGSEIGSSRSGLSFFGEFSFGDTAHIVISSDE